MQIGFLGGTGIEGKGLALRFAAAGASVIIGSRSEERAKIVAETYNELLGNSKIQGQTNRRMLQSCEIVFLTVPSEHAASAIDSSRSDFKLGTILVDVTVPIKFQSGQASYQEQPEGSNAERLARKLPEGVELVGAFKTLPAHVLAKLEIPLECDVFVCGDSQEAKEKMMEAVRLLPTLRPLDAGPLSMARTLERMILLAIQLNRRYKRLRARFNMQGLGKI